MNRSFNSSCINVSAYSNCSILNALFKYQSTQLKVFRAQMCRVLFACRLPVINWKYTNKNILFGCKGDFTD